MRMIDSAVLLTLTTALLYCASSAFKTGFFVVMGLNANVLSSDFNQSLYHGMVLLLTKLLYPSIGLLLVLTLLFAARRVILRYIKKSYPNKKAYVLLKKRLFMETRKQSTEEQTGQLLINRGYMVLMGTLALLVFLAYLEGEGRSFGEDLQSQIADGHFNKVRIANTSKELAYLYCGVRNCAAMNVDSREIVYFPQDGYTYLSSEQEQKSSYGQ